MKIKDNSKSLTTTSEKRESLGMTKTTNTNPPTMRKSQVEKYESALKWEKVKVEAAMQQIILAKAVPLAKTLIDIALTERNPNAINTLLDRAFGKSSQNINHGGQPDNPIVFLPATLMHKYKIHEGTYKPIDAKE